MPPTKVSLVRHGLVYNPVEVYYGRLPGFFLADEGRAQAISAGRHLASQSIDAIFHSPQQRAAETAALIRAQLPDSVPLTECALLNEIYSPYDGQTVAEMTHREWDFYSEVGPPYEQPQDILDRLMRFFRYAREQYPGQHVVGVSHADPIAFAIMWAKGRALVPEKRKDLLDCGVTDSYPAPASISTFTFADHDELIVADYRYFCATDTG
jgi:broad specificity phosphatase PhoE